MKTTRTLYQLLEDSSKMLLDYTLYYFLGRNIAKQQGGGELPARGCDGRRHRRHDQSRRRVPAPQVYLQEDRYQVSSISSVLCSYIAKMMIIKSHINIFYVSYSLTHDL